MKAAAEKAIKNKKSKKSMLQTLYVPNEYFHFFPLAKNSS